MKPLKTQIIAGLALFFIMCNAFGQQHPLHLNPQYLFNPYLINPAIAGSKDFSNVSLLVRQYVARIEGAPSTQILSGHTRLRRPSKDYSFSYRSPGFTNIGIGGSLYTDVIGAYRKTGGEITYAYHIPLDREAFSHLSFGLSGSLLYYSLNPNVFNVIGDPLLSEGIVGGFTPDANFGVYYYGIDHYIGISAYNLFETPLSIKEGTYEKISVNRRYFLIAGYKFMLDKDRRFILEPTLLLTANEENIDEIYKNIDFSLRLYLQTFYVGTSYRMNESLTAFSLYQFRNLNIGIAYEFPFSEALNLTYGTAQLIVGFNFGKGLNVFGDTRYW